eukprot:TRINITY_DN1929_c0_g1_i1.p2 TRINITY_DN1929_c0_g1~~TRINITY_DN1929_c0_g1_i1.p2  ORF type:complete len:126 (+),score=3.69 TRINITY_DN1929_c0_g1_i1:296-673(+)
MRGPNLFQKNNTKNAYLTTFLSPLFLPPHARIALIVTKEHGKLGFGTPLIATPAADGSIKRVRGDEGVCARLVYMMLQNNTKNARPTTFLSPFLPPHMHSIDSCKENGYPRYEEESSPESVPKRY